MVCLKERKLILPSLPQYLRDETLNLIGQALNKGSLNIETMSVKAWYKYLLEVNVTHSGKPGPGSRELVSCQVKRLNCLVDWNKSWMAAASQAYHPQ